MAIVKAIRRGAAAAGGVLDAEDRAVLGQLIVWALLIAFIAIVMAFSAGAAVLVFRTTTGL